MGTVFKKARKQAINPAISWLYDVHALSGVKFPKHWVFGGSNLTPALLPNKVILPYLKP
jgi:hypothetical protein